MYWFEIVQLVWKFFFTSAMLLIMPASIIQPAIGLAVCILMVFLQQKVSAWRFAGINLFHAGKDAYT
jgi:hypothetical protein